MKKIVLVILIAVIIIGGATIGIMFKMGKLDNPMGEAKGLILYGTEEQMSQSKATADSSLTYSYNTTVKMKEGEKTTIYILEKDLPELKKHGVDEQIKKVDNLEVLSKDEYDKIKEKETNMMVMKFDEAADRKIIEFTYDDFQLIEIK